MENGRSRFRGGLPPELLDGRAAWAGAAPSASAEAVRAASARTSPSRKWPGVGDRVFHGTFGWGVVLEKEAGGTPRCTVTFESAGTKRIVTRYLKRNADWE